MTRDAKRLREGHTCRRLQEAGHEPQRCCLACNIANLPYCAAIDSARCLIVLSDRLQNRMAHAI